MVRPWSAGERITHSSIGDRCTNDNSKRYTSVAYLPFRWHQRDPAKVRNFVSRLLHSAAVSWTELRCLPAREANGRCAVGQFRGGGRRETRRMIHLDRRAFSAPKLRINGMSVYPWTSILSVYLGDLFIHKKNFYGMIWSPSRSRISAALNMRDFCWIRSFALTEAFGPSENLSLRASKRERRKQSRSFARSKTRKRSCRRSFASPDRLKYNSRDLLWFKRKAKGLATSKRLSIIVARVPNLN